MSKMRNKHPAYTGTVSNPLNNVKPASLQTITEAIMRRMECGRVPWVLSAPDGKVYVSHDTAELLRVLLVAKCN